MKKLLALLVMAIALGCAAVQAQETPQTYVASSVNRQYEHIAKASVMVGAFNPATRDGRPWGSATVVEFNDGKWIILTAYHCVDRLYVEGPQHGYYAAIFIPQTGEIRMAKLITKQRKGRYNPAYDFAFLSIPSKASDDFTTVPLSTRAPRLGDDVLINPTSPFGTPFIKQGRIGAIHPKGTLAMIDCSATFGNSGSAVIIRGRVVGVVIQVMTYEGTQDRPIPIAGMGICVLTTR